MCIAFLLNYWNQIGTRLHNKFRFILLDTRNEANQIEAFFGGLPVLVNSEIFCIFKNGTKQFVIQQGGYFLNYRNFIFDIQIL